MRKRITSFLSLLIIGTGLLMAQTELHGSVVDEAGESVIGANIRIKGTSQGTATNLQGNYVILVNPGDILVFTYIGMKSEEFKVGAGQTTLNVTLHETENVLKDIIITGYQMISRERTTGSYDIISRKDIESRLETDIMSRIEGLVAGMNSYGNIDDRGNATLTIRGVSTYKGNRKPLYVVDGMPYEGDLALIHPDDVSSITVLKDAAANSIYGAQAANGVIVIATKKGESGKVSLRYSGSVVLTPKPDFGYLNLIGSSDLIDLQKEGFLFLHAPKNNSKVGFNPVVDLFYQHEAGSLTNEQLNTSLDRFRIRDNRSQIMDEFARTGITFQHNVSASGGNDVHNYLVSINYLGEMNNLRNSKNERIGFSLKERINFSKRFRGDFSVNGNFSNVFSFPGTVTPDDPITGISLIEHLIAGYPSYYWLRDENGDIINFPNKKSAEELERLTNIGLKDESYSPVTNNYEQQFKSTSNYYRMQIGFNIDLLKELSGDVRFQVEKGNSENRTYYAPGSYLVRKMINDAAIYDRDKKELTLNVPNGGQLDRMLGNHYSYTLRGQLNYTKDIARHSIVGLLGAERRLIRDKSNYDYYMGYDNQSLEITYIDPFTLKNLTNTESISGKFEWEQKNFIRMDEIENRYISFYANASYAFDSKYSFTGSIRIDQSNLFGTDPKYQYRPLWSLGAGWHLGEEDFLKGNSLLEYLNLRLTYGISGNVAKDAGPYLIARNDGIDKFTGELSLFPLYPANNKLRWEKTASINIGIDFGFFNSRFNGSIDLYNKRTTDLLGFRDVDPTSGWTQVLVNYGDMFNRGIELSLNQSFIRQRNFSWETGVNFSYNKNKLTNLMDTPKDVISYTTGASDVKGYPINSLFSYKYAGLSDKEGKVQVYDKEGKTSNNVDDIDALVFSGSRIPHFTSSLYNMIKIKNVDISCLFVFYGGNVLRRVTADIMNTYPAANVHKSILNRWQKPGDELKEGVMPGYQQLSYDTDILTWTSADHNIRKADYIKLRDVTVGYHLPHSLLSKIKIESAILSLQINNVWWWSANGDIDPEAYRLVSFTNNFTPSLTLRTPTTVTLGLNINF